MGTESNIKQSRAVRIWLLIIAAVLLLLFLETSGAGQKGANVALTTSREAVGAAVIVDGRKEGTVEDGRSWGVDGGIAVLELGSGNHKLELKKDERLILEKTISIDNREYIDLQGQ
ncbi:MAG: hypothetical protein KC777_13625 [Cyanobacteria bacterium HKST-UBA02]|nr:hypothetical protein [Cyanobacteria bacterium HKST-UBA02]